MIPASTNRVRWWFREAGVSANSSASIFASQLISGYANKYSFNRRCTGPALPKSAVVSPRFRTRQSVSMNHPTRLSKSRSLAGNETSDNRTLNMTLSLRFCRRSLKAVDYLPLKRRKIERLSPLIVPVVINTFRTVPFYFHIDMGHHFNPVFA